MARNQSLRKALVSGEESAWFLKHWAAVGALSFDIYCERFRTRMGKECQWRRIFHMDKLWEYSEFIVNILLAFISFQYSIYFSVYIFPNVISCLVSTTTKTPTKLYLTKWGWPLVYYQMKIFFSKCSKYTLLLRPWGISGEEFSILFSVFFFFSFFMELFFFLLLNYSFKYTVSLC